MSDGPNAIAKTYDLLKWLLPAVSKFSKDKRYTLGQRVENKLLDILELLLEANYSKIKLDLLNWLPGGRALDIAGVCIFKEMQSGQN